MPQKAYAKIHNVALRCCKESNQKKYMETPKILKSITENVFVIGLDAT